MPTSSSGPPRFGPGDSRYAAVVEKRFNKRFRATPDHVFLVRSTAEVVAAVEQTVAEGRRLAVTSGGHCLEGFVADPDVRAIVDVSPMKRVAYDPRMRAIEVEAGATVGETFRALSERWGTVLPLGEHPAIGRGATSSGGPSASCAASTASRPITSTRSRSSSWTRAAPRAPSS